MTFVIGIDFDDVLVSTADEVVGIHNKLYQTQLVRDDWCDDPPPVESWGVEDFKELVGRVISIQDTPEFINNVVPLQGAPEILAKLKAAGHHLVVVTGRPLVNKSATVAVLDRLYSSIFTEADLYFSDHYGHEGTKTSKADIALKLNLTHFIDDVVEHANSVAAVGVKTLLFSDDYIWNQNGVDKEVVRVSSWQQIGEFFDNESRKR